MKTATYKKLRDNSWGIKVDGIVETGETIQVKKKSGEHQYEVVSRVLFKDDNISICAIEKSDTPDRSGGARGASRGRKKCITGGNCSSFGSGRSCGGHDCDGWE